MRYLDIPIDKKVSKIGLGTDQFGGRGRVAHGVSEWKAIIRRALDLGVTLFDTAEIYSSGRSERILGDVLHERRHSVFLSTKMFPLLPIPITQQRARASAKRLGFDKLDLYQVHFPNPWVSDKMLMRGMRSLQSNGLIGEVGVSNYSIHRWAAAERELGDRILTNQVEYSLLHRSPECHLLPFAEEHNRFIIAYSPLAKGRLSKEHIPGLTEVLHDVASAHGATKAQIALAWVVHRPNVAAIPGASSITQLESNVAAADIALTDDEYHALQLASGPVHEDTPNTTFAALRHCARVGKYLSKTVVEDLFPRRARPG